MKIQPWSYALILSLLPAAGWSSSVRVLSDLSVGDQCDITGGQPFTPFDLYVVATIDDVTLPGGIRGAEFRIDGIDPTWFVVANASPNSVLEGSPHQGGCSVSFQDCQRPIPSLDTNVLLCTLTCLPVSPITPRMVIARARTTPADPNFACPNVVLCDAPNTTRLCLSSCGLCINLFCTGGFCHAGPPICEVDGEVAVRPSTWSSVRRLYQSR